MEYSHEHVYGLLTVDHQVREASVEAFADNSNSRTTLSTPLSSDGIAQIMNELRSINLSIAQMGSEMINMTYDGEFDFAAKFNSAKTNLFCGAMNF